MNRGDVYRLKAPRHTRAHELRGSRYAVVLQADELSSWSTVIAAPTSQSARPSWLRPEVRIAGEKTQVVVQALGAFDVSRLGASAGALSRREMDEVDDALRAVLGLN